MRRYEPRGLSLLHPAKRQRQAWWKNAWPWGIVISIGLAVLSVYVGNSAKATAGIQVALISVVLTTCIDIALKAEKEHSAAQSLLFDLHQIPASLYPVVSELAPHWRQVEAHDKAQMINLRTALAHELVGAVKSMADDRVATPRDRPYEWMRTDLSALRTYLAIHDDDLAYWNTNVAHEYLRQQALAIAHGLKVRRLFVFRQQQSWTAVGPIIAAQRAAGIEVRILAVHDLSAPDDMEVCRRYCVNRGVAEESRGVFFVTSRDSRNLAAMPGRTGSWEVLSYHQDDVSEARFGFDRLWTWAKTPEEYFNLQSLP
jgi:hypothetical protein